MHAYSVDTKHSKPFPLSFLNPWSSRDPGHALSPDLAALSADTSAAAAAAEDAARRAAAVQGDLQAQHVRVAALLTQLRDLNTSTADAGVGDLMLVPLEGVPEDVKALLDDQMRHATRGLQLAAPASPRPPLDSDGRQAYGSGYEVVLQVKGWEFEGWGQGSRGVCTEVASAEPCTTAEPARNAGL